MTVPSYGSATSDDLFLADIGYRSGKVADVGHGTSNLVSELSYNDFIFPPTMEASMTVVQEYDDHRRTVKFLTLAITVSCVITPVELQTPGPDDDTDAVMDYIRARLSQPGQALIVRNKGLGTIRVNTNSSADFVDVEYGPKSQVMDLKPIAGHRSFELTWLVTTRVIPCSNYTEENGITQSYHSVTWNNSSSGISSRTIKGKIEQAQIRQPEPNSSKARSFINHPDGLFLRFDQIKASFPPIGGYRRTVQHELTGGRNILTFTITDTEYPHDIPLFPTVIEAKVRESVSSDYFHDGFQNWSYSLAGTLKVPKPANQTSSGTSINDLKKQTWLWLGIWVAEKLKRAKVLASRREYIHENGTVIIKNAEDVYHIPEKIDITDDVWGNSFSFRFSWRLVCPSDLIMAATGLFDPTNITGVNWEANRDKLNELRTIHREGLNVPLEYGPQDYIIDLCNPPTDQPSIPLHHYGPTSSWNYFLTPEIPQEDSSYLNYENQFSVGRTNKTSYAMSLTPKSPEVEAPNGENAYAKVQSPNPVSPQTSGNAAELRPIVYNPTHETYMVTMVGEAHRLGHSLEAPNLVEYGGQTAYKFGEDEVTEEKVVVSPKIPQNNGTFVAPSIYRVTWKKTYLLAGRPSNSIKKTTGDPTLYA